MKHVTLRLSAVAALVALIGSSAPTFAQSILKTAGNYSALAYTGITVAGTGFTLTNGNIGLYPAATTNITGFPPGTVSGTTLAGTAAAIIATGGANQQAEADLQVAATGLAALPATANYSNVDMANLGPLPPGVYKWNAAATLTGALVLDAQGKNDVYWVFQFGTGLTTAVNSTVTVINPGSNGGSDDGIFWDAETGAIAIGDDNTILGNYIAYTSISFTGSTQLLGGGGARFLALNAAVTFAGPGAVNPLGGAGGSDWTGGLTLSGSSVVATAVAPTITTQPANRTSLTGTTATFTVVATGFPSALTYAWTKGSTPLANGGNVTGATTAVLSLSNVAAGDAANYSVTVSNGVLPNATSVPATLTVTVPTAPVINSPLTAAGTINVPFSYTITALGTVTGYTATGLPAGLTVNSSTGVISGTPTAAGVSVVALGATNGGSTGTATLTVTIAAANVAPIITNNPYSGAGTVGVPFSFTITASGVPTSYGISSLPPGLTLNASTGLISGIPTIAGTYTLTLSAKNTYGTGILTLVFPIASAAVAPIITSPTTAPGTVGTPFITYPIVATGAPTSYTATGLPPGLTVNPLTGTINGTPTTTGTYSVTITASNSAGTSSVTLVITIGAATVAPIITSPTSSSGTAGTPIVTYTIAATGLPTSYTATGLPSGLTINPLTGAINGTPTTSGTFVVTITATNSAGTSTASLTITVAAQPYARIGNFSARAVSGPGSQAMIVGFVTSAGAKNLLIRAIGPGLAAFGISSPLSDPVVTLYSGNSAIATNGNWQTNSSGQAQGALITATDTQVGAFTLQTGNMDAALLATVNEGAYTSNLLSPNGTSGVALTEIYDADVAPNPVARLINVSARMNVTAGQGTLIAGFVIEGNIPQTLLIRGDGPVLASYGVSGLLPDPKITVFSGGTPMATNAGWGTGPSTVAQLSAAAVQVGAFPLPSGSKDSALLVTLQPGAYTVEVTSVSGTTGVALIEVYDTQ